MRCDAATAGTQHNHHSYQNFCTLSDSRNIARTQDIYSIYSYSYCSIYISNISWNIQNFERKEIENSLWHFLSPHILIMFRQRWFLDFFGTLSKLRSITKFLDVKTGFQLFCVVSKNDSKFTFNQSKWRWMMHLSMCLQSHWRLHLIFQCVYKNIKGSSPFPNVLCLSKASTYILSF